MNQFLFIIVRALIILLRLYTYLIVASALLSWFVRPTNRLMMLLTSLTEPALAPFRSLTRKMIRTAIPFDLSPLLAYFVLQILISILTRVLYAIPAY